MQRFLLVVAWAVCSAVLSVAVDAAGRTARPLNGEWQFLLAKSATMPEDSEAWETITVPALRSSSAAGGSTFAWYRRKVEIPADWAGQRFFVELGGARYHPRVFVDGRLVDQRLEGWTPFEVELTEHVKPGGVARIDVCCQDWGAVFADGYTLPESADGDLRRNDILRGRLIAPIGGHFSHYGIWDDVRLLARSTDYLDDIAIETSVRSGRLTITGAVSGIARGNVRAEVRDGDDTVLTIAPSDVVAAGRWTIEAPFPHARFWSPETPHLYDLVVSLHRDGVEIDRCQLRFGFRELWTDGRDFVLNGVKRHLLATSGWPVPSDQAVEEVRDALQKMKAANCVAFRLHTQPWQRKWLDVADEVGIMIIEEGALWCDGTGTYAYNDERFWMNVKEHLAGMVRRDRNHASLVMWSIENEILHCGASRHDPDAEAKLADVGEFVRHLDPTHLITYEADLDPKGIADVIGLHYPHEMPTHTDYPNTADWLGGMVTTGTGGDLLGSRHASFRWDRKKPLYIGEYLWVPWTDYSPGSVFFGDAAYRSLHLFHRKAKAEAWRHQTLAYRRAGVSGLCPWTFVGSGGRFSTDDVLYQAQKAVYEPVAAFPRELDSRFFADERITRSFDVFNDGPVPLTLQLRVRLGEATAETEPFKLQPAGYRDVAVSLDLPGTAQTVPLECAAELLADGKTVHRTDALVHVFPRVAVTPPEGTRLLLYAPGWQVDTSMLAAERIEGLGALAGADPADTLLVIGPGAFRGLAMESKRPVIGMTDQVADALHAFFAKGGRAVVLEQNTMQGLPFGVTLVNHPSTMAFPLVKDGPLASGLRPEDFKFWRGDHYVSCREIRRPDTSGGRTLVVSGGENELAQGPVAEVRVGPGRAVLCQALVGAKFATEPAAGILLRNCLRYLASCPVTGPRSPALVLTEDKSFIRHVDRLGLYYAPVGNNRASAVSDSHMLVLHGGTKTAEAWSEVVREFTRPPSAGLKSIYWHRPEPETFARLASFIGMGTLQIIPSAGPITPTDEPHPLLAGVSREEFVYRGPASGRSWMRGFTPDPTIIDTCLTPVAAGSDGDVIRLEAEAMTLDGKIVERREKTVAFATAGSGTATLTVAEAGLRRVVIVAGGTPLQGVYPLVDLSVNGRKCGSVVLSGEEITSYATMLSLPAGDIELQVAFVNDSSSAGEDRNLLLDAVLIDRQPFAVKGIRFLTLPPALAVIDLPATADRCALRTVVDCICWDRSDGARERGSRYASAILANLGAEFAIPGRKPDWVFPAAIQPMGTIPYFRKTDQEVSLVASGTVEAEFDCLREGLYEACIRGRSTPADGVFARTKLCVDGRDVGEVEIAGRTSGTYVIGPVDLAVGMHRLTVEYTNDEYRQDADRNLYLHAIGFRRVE